MKYKGKELVEITEQQIFDPPKKVLVFNSFMKEPYFDEIVAAVKLKDCESVVAITYNGAMYPHCYEIPKEYNPRIATHRELSKWLAQGNGEFIQPHVISSNFSYCPGDEDNTVEGHYQVRKWDDTDWHEPDVQYMGIE